MIHRLRGFISYSTVDKHRAADVKTVLADVGVDCFLAHDDIQVSNEWRQRILEELQRMDVFVALLSTAFKESAWTAQEVGFAVARPDVPIIPVSLDATLPVGFIANLQAKPLGTPVSETQFVDRLRASHPRTLIPVLVERLRRSPTFRDAEARMVSLRPMFGEFVPREIDEFVEACIENGQVWNASLCAKTYIPEFIDLHQARMRKARLDVLQFQISERRTHPSAHEA